MSTHSNKKEKYIYNPDEVRRLLAVEYPFISIESLDVIKKGIINTSIRVRDQNSNDYLLRVYRSTRATKDIERELNFCEKLIKSRLPIAKVSPNASQKKISMLRANKGVYPVALFSFLHGKHIQFVQHDLVSSVARTHAKMHKIANRLETVKKPANITTVMRWLEDEHLAAQKKIKNNGKYKNACAGIYTELIALYKTYKKDIGMLPVGLCHLDYDSDNILETRGVVTGIVDFDDIARVPFSLDLAFSLWWWCFHNTKKRDEVFTRYIREYESQRRLTLKEKELILFFLRIRNFILLNLLFINLSKAVDVKSIKKAFRFDAWARGK
ncbi:MAG TPA: phosphotransferase [Candidatus Paceibacterota bacterium]